MTRNHEDIEKIVNDLGYELLDEGVDKWGGKRVFIRSNEGYRWEGSLHGLSRQGIRFFDVSNSHTLTNIFIWLKINRPEYELCEGNSYEGNDEKLKLFHNISECQEEFFMSWNNISHGKGCSVCRGLQVGKRTSLAYLRPDLKKEWHRDNILKPEDVSEFSNKRVYWVCSECDYGKNKEWITSISKRTNGRGCPACAGQVVTDRNRLSIWFPEISEEWDHDKNEDTPYDVSYGSPKKRWWICPNGHSYSSHIKTRTRGCGCKQCSSQQQESKIATELKQWCKQTFKHVYPEHKMFINSETNQWLRCDIYIGKFENVDGIYIEVHGHQHYRLDNYYHRTKEEFLDSQYRDKIKKKYAKKNGTYIEVDLRKIKTIEQAIEYVESKLQQKL